MLACRKGSLKQLHSLRHLFFRKICIFINFIKHPHSMALYYSKQKVKDFNEWLPWVEADEGGIRRTGTKALSLSRSLADPNEVHFVFDVPDEQAFLAVIGSAEFAKVMEESGVIGKPQVYRIEEHLI